MNDKKYIGQTTKSIAYRFMRHCSDGTKSMLIAKAIKKYGKENFYIELIEVVDTLEEANEKEVFWVSHYNAFSPQGYNLKAGGRKYASMSEETRQKISKSNLGKKASLETLEKLRISHLGHTPSEATRKKLSDFYKGKVPHRNTAIGASLKNSKTYYFINPSGENITIHNMRKFCIDNNLCISSMCMVSTGKKHIIKGGS